MSPEDDASTQQSFHGLRDLLVAHHARVLDPSTAARLDDRPLQPTVYVTDRILVEGAPTSKEIEGLRTWLRDVKHVEATPDPVNRRIFEVRGDLRGGCRG